MAQLTTEERLEAAQRLTGHEFADPGLATLALTHPSYTDEPHATLDYERLEFLGDAVLSLVVVEEVYKRFPDLSEGTLTKIKIAIVSGTTLSETAAALGLGELILLGESERGTGSRGMTSALENAFEALVGAVFLDGGLDSAREFVLTTLGERITRDAVEDLEHPKSRLQEIVQSRGVSPVYEITAEDGPPHNRRFSARVLIGGVTVSEGTGCSKREAEMRAAAQALDDMGRE
jgi:ribonuclease-3